MVPVDHRTADPIPMFAGISRWHFLNGWGFIEKAPKDGRHILVADFAPNVGFGYFSGIQVPWMAVVHYWSNPGEEGFYLSSGASSEIDDVPITRATHWMPLPSPISSGHAGAHGI